MNEAPKRLHSTVLPPPIEGVAADRLGSSCRNYELYDVVVSVIAEDRSYESGNWTPTIPAPPTASTAPTIRP